MFARLLLPALGLVLAAAAIPAPALAETASIAVPYGDLDLTRAAGRKALDQRLARAMRQVCGGAAPLRDLARMRAYRSCLAETRRAATAQVELALEAAHARRVAMLADKLALLSRF
ncbi:MAG: UrcA family protein [Erythrobacter cryptus]|jgi:UrcA family protein